MLVYIDESGDIGIQRGSRWFVLGGIAINDADISKARQVVHQTMTQLFPNSKKKYLHFVNLSHKNKKEAIHLFKEAKWRAYLLAMDKSLDCSYVNPEELYINAISILLEKISSSATPLDENISVYIEQRGATKRGCDFFRRAVDIMDFNFFRYKIDLTRIGKIRMISKDDDGLLTIADGLAHAGYAALEPCGNSRIREEMYLKLYRDKFYRWNLHDGDFIVEPKEIYGGFIDEYGSLFGFIDITP